MEQVLTIEEINSRFQSEWVLLEDPELTERLEILGGKVLCHSKDRDELDRRMIELAPRHSAVIYTGRIPEGMAIIL